jgi:hypothetical protein
MYRYMYMYIYIYFVFEAILLILIHIIFFLNVVCRTHDVMRRNEIDDRS